MTDPACGSYSKGGRVGALYNFRVIIRGGGERDRDTLARVCERGLPSVFVVFVPVTGCSWSDFPSYVPR